MKKYILYTIFIIIPCLSALATHNRAGEISFRHLSGLTYEITISTFTYRLSAANRSELTIEWGDNTSSVAPLAMAPDYDLPNFYQHNIYKATHTYSGPGVYELLVQDPNRNVNVKNIPNSVNVIFSIKSTLVINSFIGGNNSPVLLNPPIDNAAYGHIFIHNPAAYDPDGDSLSYKFSVCTAQNGKPIQGYELPAYSDTLYIDAQTGDLVWNTPIDTGRFNIAITIEEWREGIKIGQITRDMQIDVFNTDNNAPVNPETKNFCVEAGSTIEFQVTTTDADNDRINQEMNGGPLILSKDSATFKLDTSGFGYSTSTFHWQTTCDHVRRLPYQLILKSEDINDDINLVDIDKYYIRVIAPAPSGVTATSTSTQITVNWGQSPCNQATGYAIYRRNDIGNFDPDSCENGVPAYTGYVKVGEVNGLTTTTFIDGAEEEGLLQGINYCYIVTALFEDGAESYASEPFCISLVPGMPALTNVSVIVNDDTNGEIFISWAQPRIPDTITATGPYVVQIYRSESVNAIPVLIDSVLTADLSDTTYIDSPLNTFIFPYYYSTKLINNTPGNRFEIGEGFTEIASSLYLEIEPDDNQLTLNFRKKVPWVNTEYNIYKQNPLSLNFDSIGTTTGDFFKDTLLQNGTEYCYKVKSKGWRPFDSLIFTNENLSHIGCGTPHDVTPPCPPQLTAVSLCDSTMNLLTWTNPNNYCADDVIRYTVYYSISPEADMDSLASSFSPTDTIFRHFIPESQQLAGCYSVTAIDSFENESLPSEKICLDECFLYELPNVFTPNNDGVNDIYYAKNLNNSIKKVDMKIFNRWGQLVFETTNPDIAWEGNLMNSNSKVSSGVYYYMCDVYEPRITGVYIRNLVGFIHVYTEEGAKIEPLPE